MKKLFTVVSALLLAAVLFSQAPTSFKYQAVLRDARGNIRPNTTAKINIDILKGSSSGNSVYSETHNITTDLYGLINLEIGNGTATYGSISTVDWGTGAYFVKVSVDDVEMGTGQLLSVPYALYSSKASNGFSGIYDDLLNKPVLFDGTWTSLTGKPTLAPVATSGSFNDITGKPTTLAGYGITNAMTTSLPANGITSANITNWKTAYSWGNHAGLYRPLTWMPDWTDITNKPALAAVASTGSYTDLINTPSLATVANSGSYTDLINIPTLATVANTGIYTDLINTPILSPVAISGSYTDLVNKPTGAIVGDMQFWDGTNWVMVPAGLPGQYLQLAASSTPAWTGSAFPSLTTTATSAITKNSATSGGDVTGDNGAAVSARGVCWSTSPNPTISGSKTVDAGTTGPFISSVTGLTHSTTYYIRAYATNSVGTGYGNELSFTTNKIPTITTTTASLITANSASSGGDVTSDGGAAVTDRGVCWSTTTNPTVADSKTNDGTGTGIFTSPITGLSIAVTYYVRAYAINDVGTAYGNEISFITGLTVPTILSSATSSITRFTATSGGNILSDGGDPITERGVCWSTLANPTIADSKTSDGTAAGVFSSSVTSLTEGTTYYIRAYATNNQGTSYGLESSFTTLTLPATTTAAVSSITQISASGGGNVTADGGTAVLARGICWSITANPTVSDSKTTDGAGTGVFTSSITGLTPGTTYYVRAYATNSEGTSYGNELSFTTLAPPTISTTAASSISQTSATSGGNVTNDWGATVTARGVCWSTSSGPTTADNTTSDGSGTGTFSSSVTGLVLGTTYYLRAYATNSEGTSYGAEISFTTTKVPGVTTTAISSIGQNTASGGGNVTSDGGSPVSEKGICWSTSANPTTADSKTSDGTGIGAYTSSITGLTLGTTYYVRAYAINSEGTGYGNELSFTTFNYPAVTTTTGSLITSTSATGGGDVTTDGGDAVTDRGVCWSTSANPTIADSKTTDGTGTGVFTSSITGLTPGTLYNVRAYATNSVGTIYGNQVSLTTLNLPSLSTTVATSITQTASASGGNITSDGGAAVTARGVCWSTTSNPTIADSNSSDGTGTGTFTSAISGLTAGTLYYIRAYATNSVGTEYGNEISFTTLASVPTLGATSAVSLILQNSATSGGDIITDGGDAVTDRGVCWSTGINPLISDSHTTDGTGPGAFTSLLTGLTAGTMYYVRSYATNSIGTSYGTEVSFTTNPATLPVLTTVAASSVSQTTATSGGNITSDGGTALLATGVCWSTSTNPVATGSHTSDGTVAGIFSSSITGLTLSTTYYVRAYATNSVGTAYGNEISFTTTMVPLLTTTAVTSVTQSAASSGGNVTNDGGLGVTSRGVCWSTSVNPTIADSKTSDGTGTGAFVSSVTGLLNGTTYYLRAYAINSDGAGYGNEVTFTTLSVPVLAATTSASVITPVSATSGGDVTGDGGAVITVRGVCWSTVTNPTISDSKTTDAGTTGTFTSSITGLAPGTLYYVRSYATNSIGTAYGTQVSFTTLAVIPTLAATSAASAITSTSASGGGDVTSDGGAVVTVRGVCWSTSANPSVTDPKTTDGAGTGAFTSSITGLTPGTLYYVRAYATNSVGTEYGTQISFTTLILPSLTTDAASAITSTTASGGGNISNDGGTAITVRGVCWSTSVNPTIADSNTNDGTGTGAFTSSITGLAPGTLYYVKAYATNSVGTAYGNQISFTTPTIPTLAATTAASAIASTTATSGGNITSDGAAAVTARGVCWSTSVNPSVADPKTTDGAGTGSFISSVTGLTPGTLYYVRSYATNSVGTAYGTQVSFTTQTTPTLSATTAASAITSTTASSGGDVTADGGAAVTACGVCWSTSVNPSVTDPKTTDGAGTGAFISSITGLTPGTLYYVRSYATNSVGTAYGTQVTFTTLTVPALAATTAASAITNTSASSGGNVTADGGAAVTVRGVCWSTSVNPTISDSNTTDGTGTGVFTSSLTGLTAGTLYYVRAYATNSVGTAYGAQISFTTFILPVLSTTAASAITSTTASGGGNISGDGGTAVTAYGVCWSTSSNPVVTDTHTTDGAGTGAFTSSISGLTPGTLYYVRAYATNLVGTAYGNEVNFTTLTIPTLAATTAATAITTTSASSGGNITSNGGTAVAVSGLCWSTSPNPVVTDSHTIDGSTAGVFTSSLSGLSQGTTYYVRAYATNSVGTGYGTEISFTTPTIPTLTATTAASAINTTSASSGGNITSNGGSTVTASGVCWSTSANPVATGDHTTDGTLLGSFTSSITGLTQGTTYYVRAYATNSVGTAYGTQISFTTLTTPTLAATTAVSAIGTTTATSGGNIISDGGTPVTASGVCWSTSTNPLASDSHSTDGTVIGVFTSSLTGLVQGTTYYVRAYATNSVGTSYGTEVSFTALTIPTLAATTAASSITTTEASSGGNITSNGGTPVTVSGVCWSTSTNPIATDSHTTDGAALGVFTSSITGLLQGTTYYVRAYATNSVGTAYGAEVNFTTLTTPTLAATTAASSITSTTATSGGDVTSDGGTTITARGVCWSTTTGPTISDSKTSDAGTTGIYSSLLTGLTPGTLYYIRAYATNIVGTTYGAQVSFTTLTLPTLSTNTISNILLSTATSGGNISDDGGAPVTARGVCWSTSANPLASGSHTTDASGTGIFTSSLTGLSAGTIYYVRAYATNSVGTAYGLEESFKTLALPTLTTTAVTLIMQTTATSGGDITDDGGASVDDRGVCWSTSPNPTIADSKTSDAFGTGVYPSSITGLTAGTTYYVRAYATSIAGTGYGNDISFTTQIYGTVDDNDGNTYHTITVGSQVWTVENIRTTLYNDGSPITLVTDNTAWSNLLTQGYCWYNNDAATYKSTYGALYNWYAIDPGSNGGKNVCPTGWHIPTDAEFTSLTTFLGGESIAGGKIKESGFAHWNSPNSGATNESGLTALGGGFRNSAGTSTQIKNYGYFWSSSSFNGTDAIYRSTNYNLINVNKSNVSKKYGFSVRCVQD